VRPADARVSAAVHACRGARSAALTAAHQALLDAVQRIAKLQDPRPTCGQWIMACCPARAAAGATFLTTNLGWALARKHSVLLIDLNLQFGDALAYLHEGNPTSTLGDVATDIHRLDASFLTASTVKVTPRLHVLAAPENAMHAMGWSPLHVDAILQLAAAHYDFVLMDMGACWIRWLCACSTGRRPLCPCCCPMCPPCAMRRSCCTCSGSGLSESRLHPVLNRVDRRSEIGLPEVRGPGPGAAMAQHLRCPPGSAGRHQCRRAAGRVQPQQHRGPRTGGLGRALSPHAA
jgi:pilus assembly protein CpaE